jgi:hypothetical protein
MITNENSELDLNSTPTPEPGVTFRGNNYDLTGVVGVTVGAVTLFSCLTLGLGYYCPPVIPVILGIIGLAAAGNSVDPARTRRLSWISIGSGALILLLILLLVVAYIGFIAFIIATEEGNGL